MSKHTIALSVPPNVGAALLLASSTSVVTAIVAIRRPLLKLTAAMFLDMLFPFIFCDMLIYTKVLLKI